MTSDVSMIKSGIDLSNLSKDDDQKLSDIEILDDVNNSNNKNRNFNIETDNAPHLPLLILFAKFLWFGMRGRFIFNDKIIYFYNILYFKHLGDQLLK